MIKVSVIMSVYNSEEVVRESINSILCQTLKDIELIVINDGSTDSTIDILSSFNDPRVVLIDQENLGLTKSLIKAAKLAKGRYLARQDSDDVSLLNRLEKQIDYLEKNKDIALVGTQSIQIDEDGENIGKIDLLREYDDILENIATLNQFVHGSIMMRRSVYEAVGGYRREFRYSQDYDLFLRISEQYKVENLSDYLYKSRHNRNMVSLTHKEDQLYFSECARILASQRSNGDMDQLDKKGILPIVKRNENSNYLLNYHRHLISSFIRKDDVVKVRKHAIALLKVRPTDIHTWLVLILSFFGIKIIRNILFIVESVRSRK